MLVMAGGTGTRLWPESRTSNPKQFLDLLGTGETLLQMTSKRFASVVPVENHIIASNAGYKSILKKQFPKFSKGQFFLEPLKKNTAPCIANAAYKLAAKNPDAIMVVSPSDHAVFHEQAFLETVTTAITAAKSAGKLMTIGIQPTRPDTGYGYIQYVEKEGPMKPVKTFTEKPAIELAEKFIESGDFVWNAGIFVWSVKAIIAAFEKYDPEMAEIFEEGSKYYNTWREDKFLRMAYEQCRNISIDYSILEKADNVNVVLGDFGWSDLGSWRIIHELSAQDDLGNALSGNVLTKDAANNLIRTGENKLAIVDGLKDYLVIDADDVLLITPQGDSGRIQEIIRDLKKTDREELL